MTKATAIPSKRLQKLIKVSPVFPIIIFLGAAFLYPVVQLLGLSFWDSEGFVTLAHYIKLFDSPIYFQVFLITAKISFWTTIICIVAGYPVAYLLSTMNPRGRNAMLLWVLMPFWTSFLVRTFAWIVLLGRNGVVNEVLKSTGAIDDSLSLIYNFAGVMVGTSHALMPIAILTMLAVMQTIDPNLTKASGTLGARGGQSFWRIYFPLSAPGVAASALLIFIITMGFFITPILLGSRKELMIAQLILFHVNEMLNWNFAAAISVVLLLITFTFFFLYDRIVGASTLAGQRREGAASDKGLRRLGALAGDMLFSALGTLCAVISAAAERVFSGLRRNRQGKKRIVLWAVSLLVLSYLVVPAFFLIPVSFTEGEFIEWPPYGFSLRWYNEYLASPVWQDATIRSLLVATATAILSILIGLPAAFVLSRQRVPGRPIIMAFIVSPLILPHIVVAIGLFYVYAQIGLVGTSLGLVLGHTVFAVPYVVITLMATLKNYDQRLDQAAWSLGANKMQTLWRITLPILKTGVFAAFIFAFVRSLDELTVAIFVSGGVVTTLPKQMWSDALLKINPTLAAVSTCLLLFITVTILITEYLNRRKS